jgi:hypothetical protein
MARTYESLEPRKAILSNVLRVMATSIFSKNFGPNLFVFQLSVFDAVGNRYTALHPSRIPWSHLCIDEEAMDALLQGVICNKADICVPLN